MRILLVEDDQYKKERAMGYLEAHDVVHVNNYHDAIGAIIHETLDGVILDMGFPCFEDGGHYKRDHGLMVLAEMKRREKDNIPTCIYSGAFYDTKEYKNVKGYAMAGGYERDAITHFINNLPQYIEELKTKKLEDAI